jgi:hypothetical protein
VGLYKLNPVDPCLERAWFQLSSLSSEKTVSKFAFKCNLYRYTSASPTTDANMITLISFLILMSTFKVYKWSVSVGLMSTS